eukprot:CAMPEP_0185777300 /NCGR_PEP_ID=MMETSP1174-20130828/88959_1 /TAXON_ID=35687 /ORGANISM="Dictyocha speculum, Strain CCMP1381" /LENGTH=72 /DNA_ID=CAMNT_0028465617 /DNA_START=148 /DNA_END=367 /DNA_ORIENTATION=-
MKESLILEMNKGQEENKEAMQQLRDELLFGAIQKEIRAGDTRSGHFVRLKDSFGPVWEEWIEAIPEMNRIDE